MRAFLATGLVLLTTLPALAALPPQYQRQRELQAIIESIEVADAFGFAGIDGIVYVGNDVYRVTGGNCSLEVTIVDQPNTHGEGWAGPREFGLKIGTLKCE